ncbi:armadillo-type protein [Chytriomyces sp. MP71]|nr:armadillo-type protein [Chytriomyces sp. MP71]
MTSSASVVEAVLSPVVGDLALVVAHLLSANNSERQTAEELLTQRWKDPQPHLLLAGLASIAASHPDTQACQNELILQIRSLSAILLRRMAAKVPSSAADNEESPTLWALIPADFRGYAQATMLQALERETSADVRHKICDSIAELQVENFNASLEWPALLNAINECLKSPNPLLKESGLRIVAVVPSLIADKTTPATAAPIFADCLVSATTEEVKVSAIHACVNYMIEVMQSEGVDDSNAVSPTRTAFTQLMPTLSSVSTDDEKYIVDGFSFLIELAEADPRLFRPHITNLIDFVSSVMSNESLDGQTRQTAAELLIAIAEARPGMVRKVPQFATTLVPLLLSWMAKIDESELWHTTDDLAQDDDDNDEDYVYAEQAVDRLSIALGGKTMLNIAFGLIPSLLGAPEWQRRHAGLLAISVMGEGCRDVMIDSLKNITDLVIPYLRDPHPRVRYAACNCIGQMCTDFAPTVQSDYNDVILSNLVPLMDDAANPRVQAHAAAALVNFMEDADKHKVVPALDEIVRRLVGLLSVGKTYVQEQAVTSIATVADCAGKNFVNYYPAIMPVLINILQSATDKRFRLLRGKALECASLIGLAVEKEVFSQHVNQFLEILQRIQLEPKEDDDPVASYLLVAWARVCKVIGVDFVPYLSVVIPPLIKSAAVKPDMAVIDSDENTDDKYPEEDGWEFISMGTQKFGIKTNVLEDKHTAVEMICTYARDLEEHFVPYVQQVMETTVPLLNFVFHDGVRHAAASTIPLLFNCMKRANIPNEQIFTFWNEVVKKLMDFMMTEMDPGYSSHIYSTYCECLQYLGPEFLNQEQMVAFVDAAEKQMDEYVKRSLTRNASRKDVDYDEEEEEALRMDEESDNELLAEMANSIHEIFKIAGPAFLQSIQSLLPKFQQFLTHQKDDVKHFGLCVFADVVEYCGPASFQYSGMFFEEFVKALNSKDEDVRQAAAYSVGVCASKGGADFAHGCIAALQPLGAMIMAPKAKNMDNIMATENAISAVGKICAAYPSVPGFDANTALGYWLAAMPVIHDEAEADICYRFLLNLVEAQHPAVLGANNEGLPKVAVILANALVADIEYKPDLENQMVLALKAVSQAVPGLNPLESVAVERRHILQKKMGL